MAYKGSCRDDRECYAVLASVTAKYFVPHFYSCRSTCTWWLISLLAHKGSSRENSECCAVLASVTATSLLAHKGSSRENSECCAVLASVTATSLLAHKGSSREDRECCAVLASRHCEVFCVSILFLLFHVYVVVILSISS